MKKVNVYIDWFNVYHVLKNNIRHWVPPWETHMKWSNLKSLAESYLTDEEELWKVYFFTADSWIKKTRAKGTIYQKALNNTGAIVIKWKYNKITKTFMNKMQVILFLLWIEVDEDKKEKYLPQKLVYKTYEEKRTDVNIAVKIVEDAFLGEYDRAIIMSWDSDIVPAIETVKRNFPDKIFSTLWLVGTKWQLIKSRCDTHDVVWYKKWKSHLFPNTITTANWVELEIPDEWSKD